MPRITFHIDKQGNSKVVNAEGYDAEQCRQVTSDIESILGTPDESTRQSTVGELGPGEATVFH